MYCICWWKCMWVLYIVQHSIFTVPASSLNHYPTDPLVKSSLAWVRFTVCTFTVHSCTLWREQISTCRWQTSHHHCIGPMKNLKVFKARKMRAYIRTALPILDNKRASPVFCCFCFFLLLVFVVVFCLFVCLLFFRVGTVESDFACLDDAVYGWIDGVSCPCVIYFTQTTSTTSERTSVATRMSCSRAVVMPTLSRLPPHSQGYRQRYTTVQYEWLVQMYMYIYTVANPSGVTYTCICTWCVYTSHGKLWV